MILSMCSFFVVFFCTLVAFLIPLILILLSVTCLIVLIVVWYLILYVVYTTCWELLYPGMSAIEALCEPIGKSLKCLSNVIIFKIFPE